MICSHMLPEDVIRFGTTCKDIHDCMKREGLWYDAMRIWKCMRSYRDHNCSLWGGDINLVDLHREQSLRNAGHQSASGCSNQRAEEEEGGDAKDPADKEIWETLRHGQWQPNVQVRKDKLPPGFWDELKRENEKRLNNDSDWISDDPAAVGVTGQTTATTQDHLPSYRMSVEWEYGDVDELSTEEQRPPTLSRDDTGPGIPKVHKETCFNNSVAGTNQNNSKALIRNRSQVVPFKSSLQRLGIRFFECLSLHSRRLQSPNSGGLPPTALQDREKLAIYDGSLDSHPLYQAIRDGDWVMVEWLLSPKMCEWHQRNPETCLGCPCFWSCTGLRTVWEQFFKPPRRTEPLSIEESLWSHQVDTPKDNLRIFVSYCFLMYRGFYLCLAQGNLRWIQWFWTWLRQHQQDAWIDTMVSTPDPTTLGRPSVKREVIEALGCLRYRDNIPWALQYAILTKFQPGAHPIFNQMNDIDHSWLDAHSTLDHPNQPSTLSTGALSRAVAVSGTSDFLLNLFRSISEEQQGFQRSSLVKGEPGSLLGMKVSPDGDELPGSCSRINSKCLELLQIRFPQCPPFGDGSSSPVNPPSWADLEGTLFFRQKVFPMFFLSAALRNRDLLSAEQAIKLCLLVKQQAIDSVVSPARVSVEGDTNGSSARDQQIQEWKRWPFQSLEHQGGIAWSSDHPLLAELQCLLRAFITEFPQPYVQGYLLEQAFRCRDQGLVWFLLEKINITEFREALYVLCQWEWQDTAESGNGGFGGKTNREWIAEVLKRYFDHLKTAGLVNHALAESAQAGNSAAWDLSFVGNDVALYSSTTSLIEYLYDQVTRLIKELHLSAASRIRFSIVNGAGVDRVIMKGDKKMVTLLLERGEATSQGIFHQLLTQVQQQQSNKGTTSPQWLNNPFRAPVPHHPNGDITPGGETAEDMLRWLTEQKCAHDYGRRLPECPSNIIDNAVHSQNTELVLFLYEHGVRPTVAGLEYALKQGNHQLAVFLVTEGQVPIPDNALELALKSGNQLNIDWFHQWSPSADGGYIVTQNALVDGLDATILPHPVSLRYMSKFYPLVVIEWLLAPIPDEEVFRVCREYLFVNIFRRNNVTDDNTENGTIPSSFLDLNQQRGFLLPGHHIPIGGGTSPQATNASNLTNQTRESRPNHSAPESQVSRWCRDMFSLQFSIMKFCDERWFVTLIQRISMLYGAECGGLDVSRDELLTILKKRPGISRYGDMAFGAAVVTDDPNGITMEEMVFLANGDIPNHPTGQRLSAAETHWSDHGLTLNF